MCAITQQILAVRGSGLKGEGRVLAGAILLLLGLAVLPTTGARAQGAGLLAPGDAVVTGFSGITAPDVPVAAGGDPLDAFHIDLDGPSAQIFRLGETGAPPQGQLISVPATYKARAREVGQVFAIALDDSRVPNVYLGQTSAFGLQIVGPDGDGDGRPDRLKQGEPRAQWMPGQFGTSGGAGSIYRVDGQTGTISVFATIPGNRGAGLGDIVFDNKSRQFFVSDLDSGLIHRLDVRGAVIDSFDHGTAGRTAAGLPPVPDDAAQADINDAGFSVEDPGTWGFTPKPRLVWGMAVHEGRLYYAVAEGPEIWSIGIDADGGFAGDARTEFQVAGTPAGHAVSDIAFDGEGRMYLAQRGEIRGSYDYSAFAESGQSLVRRYQRQAARNPATPPVWVAAPEEYAIGFPAGYRNTAGGVALGYAYDETGSIRRGTCGRTLWTSGDNLRNDEKLAGKLGDEGPLDVHGLQGSDLALVRPRNEPPFQSYFVDYDNQFGDTGKAGHVGDVEIWQPCEGSPGFTELYPGYPPPGYVWPSDWPPPGVPPPPPGDTPTNLKLDQKALFCWSIGGGKHRCRFRVTITNTGPGVYHDHIQVRDRLADLPGVTATFVGAKFDGCPGGPPAHTCTTLAPAHLLPWEKVAIRVGVDVPDNLAKQLGCKVENRARILHAPSPGNSNTDPADDADAATALLPAHLCQDDPPKTNLRLTNNAGVCNPIGGGDKFKCGFTVRVRNMGPGVYHGKIHVTDTVPGTTTANFADGWNCPGPGLGPSYACKHNAVVLGAIQAVQLKVSINVSAHRAKQLGCKITNTAKIDFAPGGSNKNTNAADDQASATATVPDVCDPPGAKTNLALHVSRYGGVQSPECLLVGKATWCRRFRVVVENTGPGKFDGPIRVLNVPLGLPVKVGFAPGAQWTCNTATRVCRINIALPKNGISPVFNVHMSGDDDDAKALNCKVKNLAEILGPTGAPRNVKKADDDDAASYDLPAELCDPPKGKANLTLYMAPFDAAAAPPACPLLAPGATWCRGFRVTVGNTGPDTFNGPIEVLDTPPPGLKVGLSQKAQWTCDADTRRCRTNGNVALPKGGLTDSFDVHVYGDEKDAKALNCELKNLARIVDPKGPPTNSTATDDAGHASSDLPAELCDLPKGKANLKMRVAPAPECSPTGTATWCRRFSVSVRNTGPGTFKGKIKVRNSLPPGVSTTRLIPVPWGCGVAADTISCETGNFNVELPDGGVSPVVTVNVSGDDDSAKALNCKLKLTGEILAPKGGTPRNTKPADDDDSLSYDLPAKLCDRSSDVKPCPPGFRWVGDRCGPVIVTPPPPPRGCPTGMVGRYPDCDRPPVIADPPRACPTGMIGRYPDCERPPVIVDPPRVCPRGTVGRWPNCRKRECPRGTVGDYPDCRKRECPQGTVGKWPNCRKRECPRGTAGTYPDCRKPVRVTPAKCPPRTVGRPPNCRPRPCPPGRVRVRGRCIKPAG